MYFISYFGQHTQVYTDVATFSQHVVEMMLRMRREMAGQEPQITPQIDSLLILDRSVDLLTPLLSQLTYEGLIDEIFGIHNREWYFYFRLLKL